MRSHGICICIYSLSKPSGASNTFASPKGRQADQLQEAAPPLPDGYVMREMSKADYRKGVVALLEQLTQAGHVSLSVFFFPENSCDLGGRKF